MVVAELEFVKVRVQNQNWILKKNTSVIETLSAQMQAVNVREN